MAYSGNQMVKLSELLPHKRNYRTHDAQMPGLEQSLERRGQYRSIVAHRNSDGTITILAGHGVAEAAKRRGMTSIRVDMHEGLTEEQQLEILVADNELSRKAADDRLILSELLTELRNDDVPLASAGWDGDELDNLLKELGDGILPEFKEYDESVANDESANWVDFKVRVTIEQETVIKEAMDKAREASGSKADNMALEYIAAEYLASA